MECTVFSSNTRIGNILNPMKILITGATGFIGNYVITRLLSNGHEILATSTNIELAKTKPWYNHVRFIPYTISTNDSQNLYKYFEKPDLLIHLAWQGLPNYKQLFHIEENCLNNYFFVKNLVQNGLKNVTAIGTCFEYGMQEGCLSENTIPQPANAYAIAKHTLQTWLSHLTTQFPFSFKWVRLFYLYGLGQAPQSLFTQLNVALQNGESSFNLSPADQLRDFLAVETVAEYIEKIALQNVVLGCINCCSGKPITVKEFVETYLLKINKTIPLNLGYYPYSDIEPFAFWGDTQKLNTILHA